MRLHGRIDRIDRGTGGAAVRLIDYKTNSKEALRSKVRQPLEDTQLAVYAALQSARDGGRHEVRASYLALDDDEAVCEVEHPDVQSSAQRLVQELTPGARAHRGGCPAVGARRKPGVRHLRSARPVPA